MPQVAIVMPKMSMTMTEGELLVWHVEVGQEIKAGDVVCEVATDKIDMEVESTASGKVISLLGNPGDVMDVGAPLIMVDSIEDDLLAGIFDAPAPASETPAVEPTLAAPVAPVAPAAPTAAETPIAQVVQVIENPVVNTGDILATPKAREVARDLKVDLARVLGTGADGVIKHADVENLANSASNQERTLEKRLKTRLAIAKAIAASSDIPAFSMTFAEKVAWLPSEKTERLVKISSAWARALLAHPELHANWNNGAPHSFSEVKIAFSVMAPHGVVTPVVAVSANPSNDFATKLKEIISNAAKGQIAIEYLTSSTTGLVDASDSSVVAAAGILIKPQPLALSVGMQASDQTLYLTVVADHRLADPADVALLVQRFVRELG
ncbi:MAG: 2-oxo acid dehydrogenase subunit E2 [Actinobacteria bacterium]|nr:2-oxo acid dehydrogenase subunit E2 [Actinomycetota bacterium]